MRSDKRPHHKTKLLLPFLLAILVFPWAVVTAFGSGTYRPPVPTHQNKRFLTGAKLWKSRSIVGRGGKTCYACHDKKKGPKLHALDLSRKRNDLTKLIYFELVSHSRNNLVEPSGPEVQALEKYLVERFKLDRSPPPAANAEIWVQIDEARERYRAGDYGAAVDILEQAVEDDQPQTIRAEAHLMLGVIAHVLGDDLRARSEFARVFDLEKDARLDPDIYSPKTIELFESVRASVIATAPAEEDGE